jgi:hypothetical protein
MNQWVNIVLNYGLLGSLWLLSVFAVHEIISRIHKTKKHEDDRMGIENTTLTPEIREYLKEIDKVFHKSEGFTD